MDKPQIVYGLATDHSHTRETNQDASHALIMTGVSDSGVQNLGLFIVADGMIGQHADHNAPTLAAQTVIEEVTKQLYAPLMLNMGNYDAAIRTILVNAFQSANQRLLENAAYGTTAMTAAIVNAGVAYIAHVGDTSAHAVTPGNVQQLTKTHHLAHRLVEQGEATWEQIFQNQVDVTNVLYRILGKTAEVEIDVVTYPLEANSQLLLCSNGLSGWNWERVTRYDVNTVMMSAYDLQFACNRLIGIAQERDSIDAVTAILVGINNA